MKIWLQTLILLTFLPLGPLKGLFLGHEEAFGPPFPNIDNPFSTRLQPKIRLSSRLCPVPGRQKRQL